MQLLESIGVVHAPALTSGRFIVMPLRAEGLARAAAMVEADYLVRDPRPGDQQDIMRQVIQLGPEPRRTPAFIVLCWADWPYRGVAMRPWRCPGPMLWGFLCKRRGLRGLLYIRHVGSGA
jgi:hypothetical protein